MTPLGDIKNPQDILLFGKGGQVASALERLLPKGILIPEKEQADFSKPETVLKFLQENKPKLIINAAAYTAVDLAESQEEQCVLINAKTPDLMAKWCTENRAKLIHFSTDYVFFDDGVKPHSETDNTEPRNVYGKSKLKADLAIQDSACDHVILRISWVYAARGKNFVLTMLRLGAERNEVRVVDDQVGYPTNAEDIAETVIKILPVICEPKFKSWGIYHLTGPEVTSWYNFAQKIFDLAKAQGTSLAVEKVTPITSLEYPTPAKRPLNSRLNGAKFLHTFGFQLPPWEASLEKCLKEIYADR